MTIYLITGALDGRQLEIPGAAVGDRLEIELFSGSVEHYRILAIRPDRLEAYPETPTEPPLPAAVVRVAEGDLRENYLFDFQTGGFTKKPDTLEARPGLGEILVAGIFCASLGVGLALVLMLIAGLGWLVMQLAEISGGFTNLALWCAGGAGALGGLSFAIFPDYWKRYRE